MVDVARAIVKYLENEGVEYIFGLPGAQTCPLYDALYDSHIKNILVRHEQCAAYMADAYAKLTGKPGLCLATTGPGATNLVTGVYLSFTDSTPTIFITGQNATSVLDKGWMQECDHLSLFKPITKWNTTLLEPSRVNETFHKIFRVAQEGRPGPVHVDIPINVFQAEAGQQTQGLDARYHRPQGKPCADPAVITRIAALLLSAQRPVMLVGGGTIYTTNPATAEIIELAELLALPVAMTFNGFGAIPTGHPLCLGRVGMHALPWANEHLYEADLILALGCKFSSTGTNNYKAINKETKIVQVDIDPERIGKNYPVEVGVVGDVRSTLQALIAVLKREAIDNSVREQFVESIKTSKQKWEAAWAPIATSDQIPIKPQRLIHELSKFFVRDTIYTGDSGNIHYWPTYEGSFGPKTWINSGAAAPMGYALPAAIACKLVKPEQNVVAIIGDGGFAMTCQELATAVQHENPIIVIIMNNNSLGYIQHFQKVAFKERYSGSLFKNPDFALMAQAFGCYGERVSEPGAIRPALQRAYEATRNGQPAVLDVIIDPDEMLPGFVELYS
ncbi:thiamine pyrophosphate-binding protein [Neomoorella thermoacetica]|uniref:thiamine pyrophosphate-binding protein n=1 Tax=Neomoorella thermoacetica TaxID=1525 RepID=UPI0030D3A17B